MDDLTFLQKLKLYFKNIYTAVTTFYDPIVPKQLPDIDRVKEQLPDIDRVEARAEASVEEKDPYREVSDFCQDLSIRPIVNGNLNEYAFEFSENDLDYGRLVYFLVHKNKLIFTSSWRYHKTKRQTAIAECKSDIRTQVSKYVLDYKVINTPSFSSFLNPVDLQRLDKIILSYESE